MTNIKFSVDIDNSCLLDILDTTGYQPEITDGFRRETATIGTGYKLSEGYFKNVIQYNKYNVGPVVINTNEPFIQISAISDVYANNFTAQTYRLEQDGVYTISRLFVMNEATYLRDKDGPAFLDLLIYYTDGVDLYKVTAGVPAKTTVAALLAETYPTTVRIGVTKIVSTCYINKCYFKMITSTLTDCGKCATEIGLQRERDFIYMVLEAIKYLKDQGSIGEISRLIELVDTCGGYCSKLLPSNDCGCNG